MARRAGDRGALGDVLYGARRALWCGPDVDPRRGAAVRRRSSGARVSEIGEPAVRNAGARMWRYSPLISSLATPGDRRGRTFPRSICSVTHPASVIRLLGERMCASGRATLVRVTSSAGEGYADGAPSAIAQRSQNGDTDDVIATLMQFVHPTRPGTTCRDRATGAGCRRAVSRRSLNLGGAARSSTRRPGMRPTARDAFEPVASRSASGRSQTTAIASSR